MSYRDTILAYADRQYPIYRQIALDIHAHPETSNHEVYACSLLSEQLRKEGFDVTVDVAGHPTGFSAVYKAEKPGPVLAFLAEYDALADLGHGCGHNLFGATSALAGASLKQVIDAVGGEIRVYGTPGEEGAALQTGCTGLLEPTQRNLVENIIPTPSFDAVYRRVLESLGETVPPDDNRSLGSSDVGNVSQVIPVIQPMIAISDTPVAGHSIEKVAACCAERGLQSIALGANVTDGAFGENLLVDGIDCRTLPVGTRLQCGNVLLEITQIGKECHNGCAIFKRVGICIMPHEGIFARVLRGGEIREGDIISTAEEEARIG